MRLLSVCHFEIVQGCQLRCVGCVNSITKPKVTPIDVDLFKTCVENMDGIDTINLLRLYNYGEPLLHPRLPEILGIVRGQPWNVGVLELSTNGQAQKWAVLEDAIKTQTITRLIVSADGDGTPEDYERLRPPGKWQKLMNFLRTVAEMRDDYHQDMILRTRTIIRSRSDKKRWRSVLPQGWTPEFRGWMNLPDAPNVTGKALLPGKGACYFAETKQLYVDGDGMVIPCCAHPRAAELGSLATTKLSHIVKTQEDFQEQLIVDRGSVSPCNRCEFGPPDNPGQSFAGLTLQGV